MMVFFEGFLTNRTASFYRIFVQAHMHTVELCVSLVTKSAQIVS
jgi:hypothetical protein